ncbi:MAG TPA: hypothetical protein VGJ73_22315 [Verrucomicrobiae bacterium]|jgi:hypothetical protein
MKALCFVFLSLIVAGCASPKQHASLTTAQATRLAIQLANDRAAFIYHCRPFNDGQPATFVNGLWRWDQLCLGDYEANIELADDGSPNRVVVNKLIESNLPLRFHGGQLP